LVPINFGLAAPLSQGIASAPPHHQFNTLKFSISCVGII